MRYCTRGTKKPRSYQLRGSRGVVPHEKGIYMQYITIHNSRQTERITLDIDMDNHVAKVTKSNVTILLNLRNINDVVRLVRAISVE